MPVSLSLSCLVLLGAIKKVEDLFLEIDLFLDLLLLLDRCAMSLRMSMLIILLEV